MTKRIVSIVLALMMVASLCACSSTAGTPAATNDAPATAAPEATSNASAEQTQQEIESLEAKEITYPLDTDAKFTYALETATQVTSRFTSLSDTPFAKALMEQTGVEVDYQFLLDKQAFSLMFASGELADIICYDFIKNYAGGIEQAIKDNVIVPLNDYMEYAPDFFATLTRNDLWLKACKTSKGDFYGFPMVMDDTNTFLQVTNGAVIRDDWCRDLGIELPTTPSEVKNMLTLFRDEKGATVPFSYNDLFANGYFTAPFGVGYELWYHNDGTVQYGAYTQEIKDVYLYLADLYAEGLIDPNWVTVDSDTYRSNFMNGKSGMLFRNLNGGIATFIQTMRNDENPDWSCTGGPYLVADELAGTDAIPMCGYLKNPVGTTITVVTSSCKDVETAVKFLNYGFTEAGDLLYNFGVEGESFEFVDGVPTYNEYILENPNGLTTQEAMAEYTRAWTNGPFVQGLEYGKQYNFRLPEQMTAVENWARTDAQNHFMDYVSIGAEDASEFANIMSEVETYVDEMQIKFVNGELDIEENFDSYLETLKSMNIERAIELKQNALNEFNAR